MLPLILNPTKVRVGLAGQGPSLERRRAMLAEAGIEPRAIQSDQADLTGLQCLYVAGLDAKTAQRLSRRAKAAGVLVNVEDQPALCDFHVPAQVRRGDLLLTVSSAGRSPALVKLVREWLSQRFGGEWGARLDDLGRRREAWKAQSVPMSEISRKTRAIASAWLP